VSVINYAKRAMAMSARPPIVTRLG